MAFDKKAPDWKAEGIEPPLSKREIGWEVEDKPPAAWLNWYMNKASESIQELQTKAAEKTYVDEQISEAIGSIDVDIPDASLTQKGITKLSNETNSKSETEAATPRAVNKVATDLTEIKERLDTAARQSLTVQPGLQVIHAEHDACFRFGSIKGKTEINGQGRTGVIGVENPYVVRYGENLLPPFYEWARLHANALLISGYKISHTKTITSEAQSSSSPNIAVLPNTDYYLNSGGALMRVYSSIDGITYANLVAIYTKGTFKTLPDTKYILIEAYIDIAGTGTFTWENPMLTLGTVAKPFKPREDSMLAFQTELHADPTTGLNADELFEKDGQYFKLAKWKKWVLGEADVYRYGATATGYKAILVNSPSNIKNGQDGNYFTKYDGKLMFNVPDDNINAKDQYTNRTWESPKALVISVAASDSGWGDDYTPTSDEIKAYFMGWIMLKVETWNTNLEPYNGMGNKGWAQRYIGVGSPSTISSSIGLIVNGSGTHTLPTVAIPSWTPYNLLYQLATPVVESVTYEGQLTLQDGENLVDVGAGIVLRENFIPTYDPGSQTYSANATGYGKYLKYRVARVLSIFEGSKRQYGWDVLAKGSPLSGNGEWISHSADKGSIDLSFNYSITYLSDDKSPISLITGSYATNEKGLLNDLVDGVQQNAAAISVLVASRASGVDATKLVIAINNILGS
ncbi:MAG TPA: phage tail protein [Paenibacillus sp.]|jgi:hypothetical protein